VIVELVLELCLTYYRSAKERRHTLMKHSRSDRRVRKTSDKLLDVTNALHASDRRAKAGAVPEVEVERMVEAVPLFLGEELAELGVAERHSLLVCQ
jgi:hypothetical protein